MKDQKNNRRDGMYWLKGRPFVSVTTVLQILNKPGLDYWKMREVYQAVVANPSLSEQEALAVPCVTSGKAKNRGTTIHSIVEVYKGKGEVIQTTPELQPFVTAFEKWVSEIKLSIIGQERTIINEREKYAGTIDMLARINENTFPTVIDVKTSKADAQSYPEYHLQVSAYMHALIESGVKIAGGGIILLRENGTYLYDEVSDCYDEFLAAKKIWEWKNASKLKKYGY